MVQMQQMLTHSFKRHSYIETFLAAAQAGGDQDRRYICYLFPGAATSSPFEGWWLKKQGVACHTRLQQIIFVKAQVKEQCLFFKAYCRGI